MSITKYEDKRDIITDKQEMKAVAFDIIAALYCCHNLSESELQPGAVQGVVTALDDFINALTKEELESGLDSLSSLLDEE